MEREESKEDKKSLRVRLGPEEYKRFCMVMLERDVTQQDALVQAIALWMNAQGEDLAAATTTMQKIYTENQQAETAEKIARWLRGATSPTELAIAKMIQDIVLK